jgi:hypothetical protein
LIECKRGCALKRERERERQEEKEWVLATGDARIASIVSRLGDERHDGGLQKLHYNNNHKKKKMKQKKSEKKFGEGWTLPSDYYMNIRHPLQPFCSSVAFEKTLDRSAVVIVRAYNSKAFLFSDEEEEKEKNIFI